MKPADLHDLPVTSAARGSTPLRRPSAQAGEKSVTERMKSNTQTSGFTVV